MDIPGLTLYVHSYSGICGYSERGVCAWVDIPELSLDDSSYSGIRGYSDRGVCAWVDIPGLSLYVHSYSGICEHSDGYMYMYKWTSRDYPWTSTVTLDTRILRRVHVYVHVDIPGLCLDVHGYSDTLTGVRTLVDFPGLSLDLHTGE